MSDTEYPIAIIVNTHAERRSLERNGKLPGYSVIVVGEMVLGNRFSGIEDRTWNDNMSLDQREKCRQWKQLVEQRVFPPEDDNYIEDLWGDK